MKELGKFNFKVNVVPNKLEKYINNALASIISYGSFQFLSFALDNSVKNLNKDYFKYLSKEFDSNVLDLGKSKGFYSYEYMSDLGKFEEKTAKQRKVL